MSQLYKCTVCQATHSFASREDAIAGKWTLIDVQARDTRKYWVVCPAHAAASWLKYLLGEAEKPKKESA